MRLSWLLPWFLPWLTLVGMAPVFVAEGADDPSSSIPPEGVWQGVEFWVGDSADEPSVHWPGAMMTLIGHGPEGDVQRLAEAIADRVALFDAVAGLQGPMRPVVILWIEDESVALAFGAARRWVRQLAAEGEAGRLGGDVWIATGPAESVLPRLTAAIDRHQVLLRGSGLPGFLQVALLDLLSRVTMDVSASGLVASVGVIDEYLVALQGLKEWDSFVSVWLTPWDSVPPEVQARLRPQGWAFLHYFLLEREEGPKQLQDALDVSRYGAVFPAALQEAIIRPPDKLVQKVVRPYATKGDLAGSRPTRKLHRADLWPFEPSRDRVLVEFARLQQLRGRSDEARGLFERAEKLEGASRARAAAGLAFEERRAGKHQRAALAFGRAATADPVNAHWLREQASSILDYTSGEPRDAATHQAVALLRGSLGLNPHSAEAWKLLAVAFQRPSAVGPEWLRWNESKYAAAPEERQGDVAVPLFALYEKLGRTQDAANLARRHPEVRSLEAW